MEDYKRLQPFSTGLFTGLVEVWKDIQDFEGLYQVSSFGRVKSLARLRQTRNGRFAPKRELILKQKISKSGYCVLNLCKNSVKYHFSVHRLVAQAFLENPEHKPTVNHKDSNKLNNSVSNLEWSTSTEQMNHAVTNNLLEVRGAPKFTKEFKQSVYDYKKNNPDISLYKLSKMFRISERTAGRIVNEGVKPRTTTRVTAEGVFVDNIISRTDVLEIKRLRQEGWTFKQLGEKFNRGLSQMHRIVNDLSRCTDIE